MNAEATPIVRDAPPDGGWSAFERTDNADVLETRAELGLPTDRPIVMTGHHAEWWHPGLVSKFIAAQRLSNNARGAWSWTLVDHKRAQLHTIEAPCTDDEGVLVSERVALDRDGDGQQRFATRTIAERVRTLRDAWQDAQDDTPLGRWQRVMGASLSPEPGLVAPVRASSLLTTHAARSIIARMLDDPWACAHAYNRGVAAAPRAGLVPLHAGVDPGAVELPLWHTRDDGTLGRVFAGDMHAIDPARLAPRALLLTGLTRLLLCDLFIHGTGGYVYDWATEVWLKDWLGACLAPMGAITADQTLGLHTPHVDEREAARLRQYAHRARHQPVLVGDTDAQRRKLERVRTIRELPRLSRDRREVYLTMHRELEAV
ncbi:MAG: hypothetical protein AAGH64_09185, partial [Planctomycetota bacterium]